MLHFNREQTQEEKDKREDRYKAMSEDDLWKQIARFARELNEAKNMHHFEASFKTNSINHAMTELQRRGLFVEPVITATQKKKPATHTFITMEIDMERIERNMMISLTKR